MSFEELPIAISVTTTRVRGYICEYTFSDPFTLYSFSITWGTTKWILQKRYSECKNLHKLLLKHLRPFPWFNRLSSQTPKEIQALVGTRFPKKHLRMDTDAIQAERKPALALFIKQLIQLRWYYRRSSTTNIMYTLLDPFLNIPISRYIQEELYLNQKVSHTDSEGDDQACPICLCEFTEMTVTLPCKHAFHEICVFEWLELHRSCPICRQFII